MLETAPMVELHEVGIRFVSHLSDLGAFLDALQIA